MWRNQYIYSFRFYGIFLGCLIILLTSSLFSLEIARLYTGSNNRGRNDSNETFQYLIYPDRIIDFNGDPKIGNFKLENRWMWPWSTSTLLFSLIFFSTGILGILSGQRESYSSLFAFFICVLLSMILLIFIIATYSTIIAGWKTINSTSRFIRYDRNFSAACLAISCCLFIILLISFILTGRTIDICVRKEIPKYKQDYRHVMTPNLSRTQYTTAMLFRL